MRDGSSDLCSSCLVIAWAQFSNSSDLPSDATAGKNPALADPDPQWIPSVSLPRTSGWAATQSPKPAREIGRASCRERVCQYESISVVAVSLKKTMRQESYLI